MEKKDTLEIILIRHANTQYDKTDDRDPCDGDLTPLGELQCLQLGQRLKSLPIDAYLTSSLLRAFKTAAGVANAKSNQPLLEICPELIECGCTPGYYGCSESYLRAYYDNAMMCTTNFYGTENICFSCATKEDNDIRAQKVLDYIRRQYSFGTRVAIFSHHGFLEHLIPAALGIPSHQFDFVLDNASISVIELCRDGRRILRGVNG